MLVCMSFDMQLNGNQLGSDCCALQDLCIAEFVGCLGFFGTCSMRVSSPDELTPIMQSISRTRGMRILEACLAHQHFGSEVA